MKSILREGDRAAICGRLGSLSASAAPRWGRMDAKAMLAHLGHAGRMALGELPVASANRRAFQVFPMKHLILYVFPFPKGAPTATALLKSPTDSWEASRSAVVALLERIGTGPPDGVGPAHPLFGTLSRREWGVLVHKHVDHHLRQFGA